MQLEEGELPDEEELSLSPDYMPLTRPDHLWVQQNSVPTVQSSESSSDSESDSQAKLPKRQKLIFPANNKYNVWVMQEYQEDLALCMTRCVMDNDLDRNVENYPYKQASTSHNDIYERDEEEDMEEKLTSDMLREGKVFYDSIRGNKFASEPIREDKLADALARRKFKRARKCILSNFAPPSGQPRNLSDLNVTEEDSVEDVADDIATKLNETNKSLISRAVSVLGKSRAMEYYEQTRSIEGKGGLLIYDRSRKRTSGGVFLFLIRQDRSIPPYKLRKIFYDLQYNPIGIPDKIKCRRRKKAHRQDRIIQGDLENEELENPPPSPATDFDPVITYQRPMDAHVNEDMDS